jgi:hypothetical protein
MSTNASFSHDDALIMVCRRMIDRIRMVANHVESSPFIPDAIWSKPLWMKHRTGSIKFLTPSGPAVVVEGDPAPVDHNEEGAALYRWWRRRAQDDATLFADAIIWASQHEPDFDLPHNLDEIEDDLLDRMQRGLADREDNAARLAVLAWIKSRGTLDEPTAEIERYAALLAEDDLQHREQFGKPLFVNRAIPTRQVVVGVESIARETHRTPAGTLRRIQGGKIPVATIAGQPTSTQDLLRRCRRYGETAIAA